MGSTSIVCEIYNDMRASSLCGKLNASTIFSDFWGPVGNPILTLFKQKWGSGSKPQKSRILVRGAAVSRRPHWHKPGRVSDELRTKI